MHTTGPGAGSTTDSRGVRRALRAEKAQLLRWRRLLRARLDLAVAAFAPPEPLGEMSWDLLPDAQRALPMPFELTDAITVSAPTDQVALMEHLRTLDRSLASYGAELDQALETSTGEILGHLALSTDPLTGEPQDAR